MWHLTTFVMLVLLNHEITFTCHTFVPTMIYGLVHLCLFLNATNILPLFRNTCHWLVHF
jgi:hypothetical protein